VKKATIPAGVILGDGDKVITRKASGIQTPRNTGGPGTEDPGRIHYPLISLKELLKRAWPSYYAIDGPGRLGSQAVAVDATMPPGTTKEQFQEMLRNLLTDRFGLKYHTGSREVTGYALVVAKAGLKIKESEDQGDSALVPPPPPRKRGPDGFPVISGPGHWLVSLSSGENSRTIGHQWTMPALAQELGRTLQSIVADATGLTAKYDFALTYTGGIQPGQAVAPAQPAASVETAEPFPDIFTALPSQLGLKLEPKKVPVQVFVVDRMTKTPTRN
jgi:uncharacterized protein (TIGR03435 family)